VLAIGSAHLKFIVDAAEAAWPEEGCGLLVGRTGPGSVWRIDRVEPATNVADDRRRRFEVDPGVRIGLERELRGIDRAVIGVYHSHPGGPARPSATDRALVFEPHLVWLITSVLDGQAVHTAAWMPAKDGFRPVAIVETD
jgi:proteasome lid subunit RPN8/RPN11